MCLSSLFGNKKQSAPSLPPPAPTPAPPPVPVASENPVETADQRRKRADNLRQGVLSTLKSGPGGVTGTGADLKSATASGMYTSMKPKLGA